MIIKKHKYDIMINIIIIFSIILMDQISKNIAINHVKSNIREYIYINQFLNIVLVKNNGITFGLFNDNYYSNMIFSILTILIILYLIYRLYQNNNIITRSSLILIISGAFGNFIDRINHGSVIDFIDFHVNEYHWYAFNIADSAICIGAFIMLFENSKNDIK